MDGLAPQLLPRDAYERAKVFREIGDNEASLQVSEPWLDCAYDFRYELLQEFSICAYYNPEKKARGRKVCESLSLDRHAPIDIRDRARRNLHWYALTIDELIPSWKTRRLTYEPPPGLVQHNPSICRFGRRLMIAARTTNYQIKWYGSILPPGESVNSRTFLLELDPDSLEDHVICEIRLPLDWPKSLWTGVLGFEDARLFEWRGDLWLIAAVRECNESGLCEQMIAYVTPLGILNNWKILESPQNRHEKNWMPCVIEDRLGFVYLCDPTQILYSPGALFGSTTPSFAAENFRGSSQLVPFGGGYLAVVHFSFDINGWPKYKHRFVWFDEDLNLRKVSEIFTFQPSAEEEFLHGYQFVTGLCWHPDDRRLILSYQTDESSSRIGIFEAKDVGKLWV